MNRIICPLQTKSYWRLEAFKPIFGPGGQVVGEIPGSRRVLADWFPNTLLTSGRNALGTVNTWFDYCQVGTDNTTPLNTQTGLLGYVNGTGNIQETIVATASVAPWYGYKRRRWRFPVGTTAANLSEIGAGWSAANGPYLVTRSLIVDELGDPTTVTPLSDEILDAWCEWRYYAPTGDTTGTVTLLGATYDYTIRAAEVTNATFWAGFIGSAVGKYSASLDDWRAYDGNLGTVIQNPSGNAANINIASAVTNRSYSNNSYQRIMDAAVGPTGWNLAAGIRSIRIRTTAGSYQMELANQSGGGTVPKDSDYTIDAAFVVSWSEATI